MVTGLKDKKIKEKLTIIVMSTAGIALVLAGIIFMSFNHYIIKQALINDIDILCRVIGNNCTASLVFNDPKDANEILSSMKEEQGILRAAIFNNTGELFATYKRQINSEVVLPYSCVEELGFNFTDSSIVGVGNILMDDEEIGRIYIEADLNRLYSNLYRIIYAVVLIILCCYFIVLLILSRIHTWITEPINRLMKAANHISKEKDYDVRVDYTSKDELGVLVNGFNDMISEIHRRDRDLQKAKDELEHRVRIRTAELEKEVKNHEEAKQIISSSLKEKDILLKEVHHRVKNNLQIISSLLNLQSGMIDDSETRSLFLDSMSRVKSMALIHERLYQTNHLNRISILEYVDNLTRYLISTISGNIKNISIRHDIDREIFVGIDKAVPCGLIINELITNAIKYAFPENIENDRNEIRIRAQKLENNKIVLTVSDNGVGISDDIDIYNTESLGMQLINNLTAQLDAELQFHNDGGTQFKIIFDNEPKAVKVDAYVAQV